MDLRGKHEHHAQKHDVTGDSTRLLVVDIQRLDRSHLRLFNVEKTVGPSASAA